MNLACKMSTFEKRNHPRTPYSGSIFFATKSQLFEGELINFSRFGLGIKAPEPPPLDEVIRIALPFADSRQSKCVGQVVWRENGQFGVELFKKRSNLELRIIK